MTHQFTGFSLLASLSLLSGCASGPPATSLVPSDIMDLRVPEVSENEWAKFMVQCSKMSGPSRKISLPYKTGNMKKTAQMLNACEKMFPDYQTYFDAPPLPTQTVSISAIPENTQITLFDYNTQLDFGTCTTPCDMEIDMAKTIGVRLKSEGSNRHQALYSKPQYQNEVFIATEAMKQAQELGQSVFDIQAKSSPDIDRIRSGLPAGAELAQVLDRSFDIKSISQGPRSGHCVAIFDVNDTGQTENIRILRCSEPFFQDNALGAISGWTYTSAKINGVATTQKNVINKFSFRLTDPAGQSLPEAQY